MQRYLIYTVVILALVLALAAGVLGYRHFVGARPEAPAAPSDPGGTPAEQPAVLPTDGAAGAAQQEPSAVAPPRDGPGATVVVGGAPQPVRSPTAPMTMLELPDGTFVPVLNGANGAPPVSTAWYREIPWSPIAERVRGADGLEWYRHADGSHSTTQLVWRPDLGRFDATTRVGHWVDEAPNVVK